MNNDFLMLHNYIKLLDLTRETKKELHSFIRKIHYKFLILKQDIDKENTELVNRAVKKIQIALKKEIDEIEYSYFIPKKDST